MIIFNDDRTITIKLNCDREEYIHTIRALNNAVADLAENGVDYTYLLSNLVNDMLPDFRQIVNIDEVEQLNQLKTQNKQAIEALTEKAD